MTAAITFTVPGEPQGKGRPRHVTRKRRDKSTGKMGTYMATITPAKTEAYEELIKQVAEAAMVGRELITGPVAIRLEALLPIPQSWSKKKQHEALIGILYPTKKPDFDNVAKAISDGLNEVVFHDDAQVVDAYICKRYAETPGVRVTVTELGGEA
ncbi:RusA family crossover junction endodeoxyribonuclease [Chitinimonas naiadis]